MASLETRLGELILALGGDIKDLEAGRPTHTWVVGDPTPTLPANGDWIIKLGLSTTVPAWVPVGSEIQRSSYWGA